MFASGPADGGAVTHESRHAMQAAARTNGRNLIAGGRCWRPPMLTRPPWDTMSPNCHKAALDYRESHHDRTYFQAIRPGPRSDPVARAADGRARRIAGAARRFRLSQWRHGPHRAGH